MSVAGTDGALLDLLRTALRDVVRDAVREELARTGAAPSLTREYLDVATAASVAAVTPQTVRAWINAGHLTRYRAGRELRVARDELDKLLEHGTATVPDPAAAAAALFGRGGRGRRGRR